MTGSGAGHDDGKKRRARGGITPAECQRRCSGSGRFELHRHAVHAITLPGRTRPVREYVAEVTAAIGAMHLGAGHEQATVFGDADGALQRVPEARPPGAAFELRSRVEQSLLAARANECPGRFSAFSVLVPARSVPCLRNTWNCCGLSACFHSSSVRWTLNVSSVLEPPRPNRLAMLTTPWCPRRNVGCGRRLIQPGGATGGPARQAASSRM